MIGYALPANYDSIFNPPDDAFEKETPICDLCENDLDVRYEITVLIPDYENRVHAECGAEYMAEHFGFGYREGL